MEIGIAAPASLRRGRMRSLAARMAALGRLVPSSGATREIAAIDGLRALAIALVVWHHVYTRAESRQWPVGSGLLGRIADLGFSGVDLFFVLSGFLLFLPFARAILAGAPLPSTKKFYYRRVLRILPLYLFALATLLLFRGTSLLQKGHAAALLLTVLLLHDTTHASMLLVQQLNIVFWTLAVEWQFYLLLPWIARGIRVIAGRPGGRGFYARFALALGALVIWGLGTRVASAVAYYHFGIFPVSAPHGLGLVFAVVSGVQGKYLETFALGMGLSVLYIVAVEWHRLAHVWGAALGIAAVLVALAGLAGCVFWGTQPPGTTSRDPNAWIFGTSGPAWMVLGAWVLGVCYALLVFAVLLGPRILRGLFALAPLRYIGIISYSIYVWHLPIVNSLAAAMPDHSPAGYLSLLAKTSVAVLLYCSASYFIIERPFLSLRRAAHSPSELQLAPSAPVSIEASSAATR
jgi:peptidoglycan/LPS O-acetylase OafA/YrhL